MLSGSDAGDTVKRRGGPCSIMAGTDMRQFSEEDVGYRANRNKTTAMPMAEHAKSS